MTALASAAVFLLCCLAATSVVRADAPTRDPAQLIVPSGHDDQEQGDAKTLSLLQEKTAALNTAEKTIHTLEGKLAKAVKEQEAKASALSAAETEARTLGEQIKALEGQMQGAQAALAAAQSEAAAAKDAAGRLEKRVGELEASVSKGAAAGSAWEEDRQALQSEAAAAKKEATRLEKKVEELEASVSKSAAAGSAWEEERRALQGQVTSLTEETKKAATLAKAKDAAQARISVLETEVANAGRKAQAARSELEQQLRKKEKEIVEMQHVLQDTLDNKYSLAVLSADLSTWSKGVGWTIKEKSVKGFHWTVAKTKHHGTQAQVALQPHLETAVEKLGELHREASKVCLPLVEEHVAPHYEAHVKPRVEQTLKTVEPLWREEVQPRVLQGVAIGKTHATKGWKVVKAKASKGREQAVAWVNQQEWAEKNGEGIVTAGIYILVATLLFLLRFAIWGVVRGVGSLMWWVIRLPFVIVYWCIFWPTLLFGKKKSNVLDTPLGHRGGAGNGGGRKGGNGNQTYPMPMNPHGPPPTHPLAQPQYGR